MSIEDQAFIEANQLSPEQLERFYYELNKIPSVKAPLDGEQAVLCFQFMEDTGVRVNELTHIKKEDINLDTGIFTVTNPKVSALCHCAKWVYRDLRTRIRIIEETNPNCKDCLGKGRLKKPQKATITPRLIGKIRNYTKEMKDESLLFDIHRSTLWKWGKKAGSAASLRIFQVKKEQEIKGIFIHLFRALCSKRMVRDAAKDPFIDELIAQKLRHSFHSVTDRYTKVDIMYLWNWEQKTYGN